MLIGKEERAMLLLAVDQFIQHTKWLDVGVRGEWLELLDALRSHRPGGEPQIWVELLEKEDLFRLQTEISIQLAKHLKTDIEEVLKPDIEDA